MRCVYLLESPQQEDSKDYQQHMSYCTNIQKLSHYPMLSVGCVPGYSVAQTQTDRRKMFARRVAAQKAFGKLV